MLIVLATKETSCAMLVSLNSIEINPFLKLPCNIYWCAVFVTGLFQNVSCSKCLLLKELVSEMLFLSEQSPLNRLYLCCILQCFSVLTQSMSSKCI